MEKAITKLLLNAAPIEWTPAQLSAKTDIEWAWAQIQDPHSEWYKAEMVLLGAIMMNGALYGEFRKIFAPIFEYRIFSTQHANILRCIEVLYFANQPIHLLSVFHALRDMDALAKASGIYHLCEITCAKLL